MRRANIWLLIGLGVVGAALTGWATNYVLDSSQTEAEARFDRAADRLAQSLVNRMTQYEQGLVAGAALVSAVGEIDRAAWGRFVAGQNIRARFPGIQAMGLASWVADTDRAAHVAAVRAELPTYDVRPPGERATYLPILFNEPYEGRNRTVVGFDMLSEPIRRTAITRAASSGEPSISGMVVLAGEGADARPPGFVFYVPTFSAAGELRGMVFAPFRAMDLIEAVRKEAAEPGLSLTLKDGQDTLYSGASLDSSAAFGTRRELRIAGRIWALTIDGDQSFLSDADRQRAWIIAAAGGVVTLTLIGAFFALIRSKIAESRFRVLATLGSDWLWEQDEDQRFTYISDPARFLHVLPQSLIGVSRRQLFEEIGEPIEQARHADLLERMKRHEPIRDFEYRARTTGGELVTIMLSAEPTFGLQGRFNGYVGISKNVTRERARDEALLEAKQSAEAANRAKSAFLATMSHELRTPLNAIIGFAEVLELQLFGPDATERYAAYARDIRQSGEHLRALVSDILDLAKIESGELALSPKRVDVADTLEGCLRSMLALAQNGGVAVTVEKQSGLAVAADPRALKQVLLNLLSNAVKFTKPGGQVTIAARQEDASVVIEMRDTGVGIPSAALARIFDPFYQADPTLANGHAGTGLGLSISKKLVEAMGGRIVIESVVGQGTAATVSLPAALDSPPPEQSQG